LIGHAKLVSSVCGCSRAIGCRRSMTAQGGGPCDPKFWEGTSPLGEQGSPI